MSSWAGCYSMYQLHFYSRWWCKASTYSSMWYLCGDYQRFVFVCSLFSLVLYSVRESSGTTVHVHRSRNASGDLSGSSANQQRVWSV